MKGITYTRIEGRTFTVVDIGDEQTEDGPNIILREHGRGGRSRVVMEVIGKGQYR